MELRGERVVLRPLVEADVPRIVELGRGLGTDAVRAIAGHLIRDRGHHRLTIDPAAHNERAVRCYEKVGFRPVGVMREYWRDPDGVWRDGLLLDLLAKELT